ncbi:MAG: flavodoxin family protein [Pseudomonadota bacterium]
MSPNNLKTKILALLGSPRKKGNSALLAHKILEGAKDAGAEIEAVYLNSLKIAPCQACNACRKPEAKGCAVNDDMQSLYPKIKEADVLVFASPIYWFTVSAQLKLVMDRLYAFGADGYTALSGKKAAAALSFAGADVFDSGCVNALRTFQDAFKFLNIKPAGFVYGKGWEAGEISADAAVLEKAVNLGRELA